MIKTKINKVIAATAIAALATASFSNAFAANIGTGSITGSGASATAIVWDDTFPGFATGSVTGIKVNATVEPTLNMVISATEINLGTLVAGAASDGTLNLEIGTNAANGVAITAKSTNGGLQNTSDAGIQIDNHTADGVTSESYTFASTANVADDSSYAAFAYDVDSDLTATEVADNTTEYKVYGTNKPEASTGTDDVVFTVSATSDAQTAAWEYEDFITFTVVGNF